MATDPETGAAIRGSVYSASALVHAGFVLVLHIVGFFGVGLFAFKKKDILSQ